MHQPSAYSDFVDRMHQRGFNALYDRSLLYNTCWEDPALDREAMRLKSSDNLVMITSAGCNALDYAIEQPNRITCIDANSRQNAVLQLKIAGIRHLDYDDFFKMFGMGVHPNMRDIYNDVLRDAISPEARQMWDSRLHWWNGKGWRNSFYYYGLSGLFARCVSTFINSRPGLWRAMQDLMSAESLEQQQKIFHDEVARRLFPRSMKWVLGRQMTMNLLGVPREQGLEVKASHDDGIAGFIESCIEAVCCQLPFQDNYFWRVYLNGSYSSHCCPRYLQPNGFLALKNGAVNCIETVTDMMTNHLQTRQEGSVNKFILLDHMDWMGSAYPAALRDEWQEILRTASSDSQILFRSGAHNPAFLDSIQPDPASDTSLRDVLDFDKDTANRLHQLDRVHTYASFHIARPRPAVA
jgi:S-adenosylmethionine-diacylglycerol 3-amino-3-carboxypropyl transferase